MAPGSQLFSLFQTGKETTKGTAVAATRQWYPDGTGIIEIDPMLAMRRGNRGTRTQLAAAATRGVAVNLSYRSNSDIGVAYDELVFALNFAGGGTAGTGASADKSWTWAAGGTATTNPQSYTIEVGDDVQFWEFEYSQARAFTLSAAVGEMTQLEMDFFARQPTKTTKTSLSANTAVRIPGNLWKPSFGTAQAELGTATPVTNFLLDWSAEITTGLTPRFYQDGNAYFGQSAESIPVSGIVTLHVESTSQAVSQFYDKWYAQTMDFLQLKATGPTLGSSTYSAALQFALIYTDVKPIASEQDGVNIYEITAETAIDSTWGQSMGGTVVNSIAALTA
jgi:hypothetical protein